ncbi:hypothetical protein [Chamaesiphon sp.]
MTQITAKVGLKLRRQIFQRSAIASGTLREREIGTLARSIEVESIGNSDN